ncbi:POZ domain-containing protein [Basidiobolus meristosporus CBS 931.73]|uniref:Elongin-C n=1 Tax=Basidiobolus meristosporus CBS 931.73 TaxID=1314790 RepID=A0A1Y1XV58_9FUNG|eukprot:ORX89603.1 POZ domain-containing protein [Basidiobolus meristosporus CBS 931.73]
MTEESQDTTFVTLTSSDGFEFHISKQAALGSGTIRNMLSSNGPFTESLENEIHFREIRAVILERVCQYLYYKLKYTNSTSEMPDFGSKIEPEIALELLMAADFLEV